MTKHLRFLFVMLLAMIWSAGWAQEVTMNFTDNTSWNFPIDSKNTKSGTYGKGNSAVSLTGGNYYSSNKYLMLKKNGTLTFATFNFDVEKIVITGNDGASPSTKQNIYVGNVAVSSETIGSKATNTYLIKDGYQSAGNRYVLKVFGANAQITKIQIYKKGASSSTKTDTKVSFGENSGKTFTFTEGKYSNSTFTTPTATETNGIAGTVAYSSSNATAISVDASTGALTFSGYGTATITATFTPNNTEKYAESTDSYIVENKSDVVAGAVVFDGADDAFAKMTQYSGSNTIIKDQTIVDANGTEYVFRTNGGKMGSCIQLKSKTGEITSPTFDNFSNGYTVIITYGCGGTGYPTLSADGNSVKVEQKGDVGSGKGVEAKLLVSNSNAFTFACGDNYVKISKIEIVPNKVGVTLDENSESNTFEAKTGVNVTLKRSMVANEWNTICLPFALTEDKAKAAFGNDVKIAVLDTDAAVDANVLSFKASTGIVAATPYLIKPSTVSETGTYTFEGVDITETNDKYAYSFNNVTNPIAFKGIYNMVDITKDVVGIGDNYYAAFLGAGNKIYKANGSGNKTKGFRAYFAIPNGASASALRVVIDGTATSIKNIDSEVVESNAPVYNLQGQRVNGNNLTPGIYVKAGKKFVVK